MALFGGPTAEQLENAITAVEAGNATRQQRDWVAAAANQAGSTGSRAREAQRQAARH